MYALTAVIRLTLACAHNFEISVNKLTLRDKKTIILVS